MTNLELGLRLHLLHHPKVLNGRSCPDASPTGASGTDRKPAEVQGHVHIAARVRPTEAIWVVGEGGPMALLPLVVRAVDKDSMQPVIKGEVSSSTSFSGGHGIVFDGPVDEDFIALVEKFWANGKIVSAGCHGPDGLVAMRALDGTPIVKGKKVAGFSNSEEAAVGATDKVPFLLEDKLKELGGHYEVGPNWLWLQM